MSSLAIYAVRASLLLALGVCADRCLRKRSAAVRHLSWSLFLAASLLVAPLSLALPELKIPMPELESPLTGESTARTLGAGTSQAPWLDRRPVILGPARAGSLTPERAFLFLWLAGSLILLARLVAGRLHLARIRRRARPLGGPGITKLFDQAAAQAGCRRRAQLLRSEEIAAPATFGLLRPAILLPAGAVSWSQDRLRAVLLHELSHVARVDPLPQLVAELDCALHWLNPLSWYAARRLARERERACDDRVLAAGITALDYARQIVEVARQASLASLDKGPRAAMAIVRRSELESRLLGILNPAVPRARTTARQYVRLLAAAAVFATGLGCLGLAPATRAVAAPEQTFAGFDEATLADPRSEIVPFQGPKAALLTEDEIRRSADGEAIRRLQAGAAHTKTSEGDLVRERAEWALTQVRDGEIVHPLLRLLESEDWRVQCYAAWSLGVAGDRRAVHPIARLLDHPVWRVRAQALGSLLDLAAELPAERLDRLAADPAWQVRIEVVDYLQRHPGAAASALLRTMANDPHGGTRSMVQAALAEP